jgi:Mg2+ and Co2+ transporter CorA
MPELEWSSGYYAVLLVMLSVALLMVAYFRRRKWI